MDELHLFFCLPKKENKPDLIFVCESPSDKQKIITHIQGVKDLLNVIL